MADNLAKRTELTLVEKEQESDSHHESYLGDDLRTLPGLFEKAKKETEDAEKIRAATIREQDKDILDKFEWACQKLEFTLSEIRKILAGADPEQYADFIGQLCTLTRHYRALAGSGASIEILPFNENAVPGLPTLEELQYLRATRSGVLAIAKTKEEEKRLAYLADFVAKAKTAAENYEPYVDAYEITEGWYYWSGQKFTEPVHDTITKRHGLPSFCKMLEESPVGWGNMVYDDDVIRFRWLRDAGYKPQLKPRAVLADDNKLLKTRYFVSVSLISTPAEPNKKSGWLVILRRLFGKGVNTK